MLLSTETAHDPCAQVGQRETLGSCSAHGYWLVDELRENFTLPDVDWRQYRVGALPHGNLKMPWPPSVLCSQPKNLTEFKAFEFIRKRSVALVRLVFLTGRPRRRLRRWRGSVRRSRFGFPALAGNPSLIFSQKLGLERGVGRAADPCAI